MSQNQRTRLAALRASSKRNKTTGHSVAYDPDNDRLILFLGQPCKYYTIYEGEELNALFNQKTDELAGFEISRDLVNEMYEYVITNRG